MLVFFWFQMSPLEGLIVYSILSAAEASELVSKKNLGIPGNSNLLSEFLFDILAQHTKYAYDFIHCLGKA